MDFRVGNLVTVSISTQYCQELFSPEVGGSFAEPVETKYDVARFQMQVSERGL